MGRVIFGEYEAYSVVKASTLTRGAVAWSQPVEISARGSLSRPQIQIDQAGNAIALWTYSKQTPQANTVVQSASKPAAGTWSAAQDVSASAGSAFWPDLAMNSTGVAIAVWSSPSGPAPGSFRVQATFRTPGGPWRAPASISNAGQIWNPQIAIDDRGVAAAVWDNQGIIEMARWSQDAGWTSSKTNLPRKRDCL